MLEFLSRLGETGKYLVGSILFIVMLVFLAIVILVLVFVLPIYLLSMVLGQYAGWWFIISAIGFIIFAEWDKLSRWAYWQFIEPFKK